MVQKPSTIATSHQFQTALDRKHTAVLPLLVQDSSVLSTWSGCSWKSLSLISAPLPFHLCPHYSLEPAFLFSTHLESWTLFPRGTQYLLIFSHYKRWVATVRDSVCFPKTTSHCPINFLFFKYTACIRDCYLPQGFLKAGCKDAPCKLVRNAHLRLCPEPAKLYFYKTHRLF